MIKYLDFVSFDRSVRLLFGFSVVLELKHISIRLNVVVGEI